MEQLAKKLPWGLAHKDSLVSLGANNCCFSATLLIPGFIMFEGPFYAESFTCNCLSCYLHSVWDEYQVFHLIRYLADAFPWDTGSPLTGSGVSILDGFLPEVLCVNLCNCELNSIFPCDFKPFWLCHRRIVSLFFDSASKQDFFSVTLFPFPTKWFGF